MAKMKPQREQELRAYIGKPGGRESIIGEYKKAMGMSERELPRLGLLVSEMIEAILEIEYGKGKRR